MPKSLDITNQIFGNLKALKKAKSRSGKTYWLCECLLCGNQKEIQTSHLTSGATKSCGCQHPNEKAFFGNIETKPKTCILCQKEFIPNVPNRVYCFDCSPEGADCATAQRLKKRALKHYLIKLKGGKCERCGYDKCEGSLQFHHTDPSQKEFTFSHVNLNDSNFSIERFVQEVEKCELLCANCHFEEHYLKED